MALCVVLTMSITPVVAPKSKTIHHGSRKCSLGKEARETYTAYIFFKTNIPKFSLYRLLTEHENALRFYRVFLELYIAEILVTFSELNISKILMTF